MLSVIENLINLILIKHLAFNLLLHLLLAGGWEKLIGHLKSCVTHALTGRGFKSTYNFSRMHFGAFVLPLT